jgi:hypothetical protein
MTMAMTQLDEIRGLDQAFAQAEVAYWLFGGWAVDFHAGRVTRAHSDVDIAGVRLDIALLERDSTGAIYTPTDDGRGEWPDGSFGTAIVSLLGVDAHIIDAKSLIADKSESHGADADVKDEADLRVLRSLDERPGPGPRG